MRILFLSRWYPYPADNGSKIRIYNLLRTLAKNHQIDLISFAESDISEGQKENLKTYCQSIQTVRYRPFQPNIRNSILGLLSPTPRSVLATDNEEMHAIIHSTTQIKSHDLVIASEIDMIQYAQRIPASKILEDFEVATIFEQLMEESNPIKRIRYSLRWRKWERYVANTFSEFNGATVVSEKDQKMLENILSKENCLIPICVIPNGTDVEHYQGDFANPRPETLIFSGALTYNANYDAMEFFLGQVYPLILKEMPNVSISITGKLKDVSIDHLPKYPGINFTGYLEDIRPAIAESWVSVVPLRMGSGTRLKILESLALGTPVVSTTKGAEGLELTPGQDLLIADSPETFANAVLSILKNSTLREILRKNGRTTVRSKYNWQTIGQMLNHFIEKVYS